MSLVVKISGSGEIDPENVLEDLAGLSRDRELVIVHGGSSELDRVLRKIGKNPVYVETPEGVKSRFTDEETMEVFNMVMAGKINVDYTSILIEKDVKAVGLSGVDGSLLEGPRKSALKVKDGERKKIKRGEHSGKIENVNSELIERLWEGGYVPVVSLPMIGDNGTPVNADGDRAAAAIAGELGAKLVITTDVPGVMRNSDDRETVIQKVENKREMEEVRKVAKGFMKKKVMAVEEALEKGAEEVIISGSESKKPVTEALNGAGTSFKGGAV